MELRVLETAKSLIKRVTAKADSIADELLAQGSSVSEWGIFTI